MTPTPSSGSKSDFAAFQVGQVVGHLTVTGLYRQGSRSVYGCRCVCGKTVFRRASLLRESQTHSCGCQPRGNWRGGAHVSMTIFGRIQRERKKRELVFDISLEEVDQLFERQ